MTEHAAAERRQRTLTKHDLADLAKLIKEHNACTMDIDPEAAKIFNKITPEQWGIFYRVIVMLGRAANITGAVFVATIAATLIAICTKSFWLSFATAIKKAGGQ